LTKVIVLVTSDIVADQRVHRTASTLVEEGYLVSAIGRRLKKTPSAILKPYKVYLFSLPFNKGLLFYASFNIWAFFHLLFKPFDLLHANDLDTLLAARLACLIKGKPLVFDSHELFTELPELINRNKTKNFWAWLAKNLTKGLKHCSTVSYSIANELKLRHGVNFVVIRNVPHKKELTNCDKPESKTIIYQGALNVGRGIEKMISAMQLLPDFRLIIAGTGSLDRELKALTKELGVESMVTFLGRISLDELHTITCNASLGISLEEDLGLNYRYALPNKLFDYIQAGLPVLTSNLPEMEAVVTQYAVGQTIESDCSPTQLANKVSEMFKNQNELNQWKESSIKAASILTWENEKDKLVNLVNNALVNRHLSK
jgi:glycosyltransferase involved in cell wall biosynthesis